MKKVLLMMRLLNNIITYTDKKKEIEEEQKVLSLSLANQMKKIYLLQCL